MKSVLPAPAIMSTKPALVVGGAGFIGSNLSDRLAHSGCHVLIYDALLRPGVEANVAWLRRRHPRRISVSVGDVRESADVKDAVAEAAVIFHLAAQVAVTSSFGDPRDDFETNVAGTLNLLEAARRRAAPPPLIFASTNKVYGDLADICPSPGGAYFPRDPVIRRHGIGESRPLCFRTPYGCSKGAADQYVLDYAHSFGLKTAVMRMSCIFGPRQLGTEDQGWVAHFLRSALAGKPITLFGDGRQVRDLLFVDDAAAAYVAVWDRIDRVAGQAFNLGGGPANAVSLLQVLREIENLLGRTVPFAFAPWRPGDQRYFVADTRRARRKLGLTAPTPWREGLHALLAWLREEAEALPHPIRAAQTSRALEAAP